MQDPFFGRAKVYAAEWRDLRDGFNKMVAEFAAMAFLCVVAIVLVPSPAWLVGSFATLGAGCAGMILFSAYEAGACRSWVAFWEAH